MICWHCCQKLVQDHRLRHHISEPRCGNSGCPYSTRIHKDLPKRASRRQFQWRRGNQDVDLPILQKCYSCGVSDPFPSEYEVIHWPQEPSDAVQSGGYIWPPRQSAFVFKWSDKKTVQRRQWRIRLFLSLVSTRKGSDSGVTSQSPQQFPSKNNLHCLDSASRVNQRFNLFFQPKSIFHHQQQGRTEHVYCQVTCRSII